MTAKRCRECGKKSYNEARAYQRAVASSRAYGCSFRIYECPHQTNVFHLTTRTE